MGGLSKYSAVELAIAAGRATLENVGEAADVAERVDRVIVGNVLSAGLGMTIARQIGVGVGVPHRTACLHRQYDVCFGNASLHSGGPINRRRRIIRRALWRNRIDVASTLHF